MSQILSATAPAHSADMRSAATLPNTDHQMSERVLAETFHRILPFIFACYVTSYLDRTNVGFTAFAMSKDIGLTAEQFGFGAGLFFIGCFLFEIPDNLIMQKVGARIWIARIMIMWGIFSMATVFVVGPKSFAAARFLLGLAEVGSTPDIYLYFMHWFPGKWRTKVTAAFLVGIPVANMIGSPSFGVLLELGGLHGLRSRRWLLLVEGLPAVLSGIAYLFVLADRPEKAKRLIDDEKVVLARHLTMGQRATTSKHDAALRDAMTNWRVFVLAFINFCGIVGSIGVGLWMLQIVKQFGIECAVVGWLMAIPYALDAVVMLRWARMANRAQNHVLYVAAMLVVAAVALAASTALDAPTLKLAALCLTVSGILALQATFWVIPSTFLTDRAAAGGLALIVSVDNLGDFVGPSMVGAIRQFSQDFTAPLLAVPAVLLIGALSTVWLGNPGADAGEAVTR